MKSLLHKPIVFTILLLLIGLFYSYPTAFSHDLYASVTIYSSDDDNRICPGGSVTFTAIASGGTVSSYNWYKNGLLILEHGPSSYTISELKDGDYVDCIAWVGGVMVFSNAITIRVGTNTPYVEIESNDADNAVCAANDDVTFTATPYSTGGGTVAYQWKVNGSSIGYNSSAFRTTNLKDDDIVTCEITVTGGECLTATTDVSNAIQMEVMQIANPSVSVVSDDADNIISPGTNVTFTATTLNTDGFLVNYRWTVNGTTVGTNQNTYATNTLKNMDIIECFIVVDGSGCWERNANSSLLIQIKVLEVTGPSEICVDGWEIFNASVAEGVWSSSDESIAYIDMIEGSIKGVKGGDAIITYTLPSGAFASKTIKVLDKPFAGRISMDKFILCIGSTAKATTSGQTNGIWGTDNSAIATIDPLTGLITGVGEGNVRITYTVRGADICGPAVAEDALYVAATPPVAGVISGTNNLIIGDIVQLTIEGNSRPGLWSSNDPSVATIDEFGYLTAVSAGSVKILYTVTGDGGCTSAVAEYDIAVSSESDPGELSGTQDLCVGGFSVFSSTVPGGRWTSSNENVATIDLYRGLITAIAPGPATMTYTVEGGATATRTVVVHAAPNAGLDATLTVCGGVTPSNEDLFNALGGSPDPGGIWSGPIDGVYTYTVNAVAPCTLSAQAKVTVTEQAPPNAGTDATLTICKGWMPSEGEMFAALGGNPDMGGEWWFVDDTHYKYVVRAKSPCDKDASAIVTLTQQNPPNAGTDGMIIICEGTVPTDQELFSKLGGSPDIGGTWELVDGTYYKYTVRAVSPCLIPDEAIVTVRALRSPNAGQNGTLEVCAGTIPAPDELFDALEGEPDPGGSWSGPIDGVYTYMVQAAAPCVVALATVTVTEKAGPNAGLDGNLTICSDEILTESRLFSALSGNPDLYGKWTPPSMSLIDGVTISAVGGPIAGVYTYTVPAIFPCTGFDEATVTVIVQAAPNAGIDGSLEICAGVVPSEKELFDALGGAPDIGGSWSDPVNGVYTYTVTATAPCNVVAQAKVTVTERSAPNAGDRGTLIVCAGTKPSETQLFGALLGSPDAGGTWTGPVDGAYTYTVKATSPCTIDDWTIVVVRELIPPNAGQNGTLSVCAGTTPTPAQLFEALEGSPQIGGTWSAPVGDVYTYTVAGMSPCPNATAIVTVTQIALPALPGSMGGSSPVCEGTEQVYYVPAVTGMIYNWTVSGTGWNIQSGQGTNSINVIVGSSNAIISVTAENAAGCVSIARSRTIAYRPIPSITSTYIDGVPGLETTINYGCASPLLKVADQSGSPLYSYQWFKCNSDGSVGTPVSAPVLNLFKGNQYMVPPANGYYDVDYGDQKGIGAGTHYYYAIVTTTAGCSSKSPIFKVVIRPAEALGDYDAKSYYTGPKFVWTTTTTSNTATATLTAFVRNKDNETCGDIATARVSFEFRTSSGDWNKVPNGTNLPVSYVDPRDPAKGGTASVIAQLSIPQNQNSENYDIRVLVGGNYYNASPSDAVSICQIIVGKIVPGGSIAGGVHLPNLNSSGYIQGTTIPPSYLCFGVEYVQKGKSVTNPKGRVTLRVFSKYDKAGKLTSNVHTYVVRSNAIAGLSITGNKATFTAKSNIAEEIPDPAYPGGIRVEPIEGNCVMTLKVEDWCNTLLSNVLDKVGITIQRNAGGIWYSNNWIKSKTEPAGIFGGDILVIAPSAVPVASGTGDMNSKDATASFGEFNVKVFGNPSSNLFNVSVTGSNDKVAMRVVDINGRLLETRSFAGNSNIQFGSDYHPGTYFAQFIQGEKRKTLTLIKSIR